MDDKHGLLELFEAFKQLKVLVVGDVMIDAYIYGDVNRISPEAPIPVLDVTHKKNCLGGAANVALNIESLGATAHLFAVAGKDSHCETLLRLLEENGLWSEGLCHSSNRRTTVKSRIISNAQHLLRFDEEDKHALNESEEQALLDRIKAHISDYDAVVFEDYDKGCLNQRVIEEVIGLATRHGIPTLVDPKKDNFMDYIGVTLFKPNLKELSEGLKRKVLPEHIEEATSELMTRLKFQQALVTLSQHGVFYKNAEDQGTIPAHVRNIANVSGAGDTVIAVAALCLAAGASTKEIAQLANLAGGIVCESPGIVPIDRDRLIAEIEQNL
ncbi:MAG: bifunctional ADP-heptose synthase [Cytophagales bacterium]|nr:bifunctional ADP-heptose synthase [Cytophagales bacterium]